MDFTLPLKSLRDWFQVAVVEQKKKDIAYMIRKVAKDEEASQASTSNVQSQAADR